LLLALERRRIAHPKAQDYANFQVGLQQGFAPGEMGCNDKFAVLVRFGFWPFSNSGRALALIAGDLRRSNVSR
jgi:hypothetical protein